MEPRRTHATAPFLGALFFGLSFCGPSLAWAGPSAESRAFQEAVELAAPSASAKGKAGGVLGSVRMRKANRVAAEMVRKRRSRDDLALLAKAGEADVVVVAGEYDRAQDALSAMGVAHVVIRPRHLAKLDLLATQTLLVNCPGTMNKAARANVESFVRRGGFLVTTDWALKRVVQKIFPETIRHNGVETDDDVVGVQVHDHPSEHLLAGMKLDAEDPQWWLEGSSYPIKIVDKEKVKVLLSSKEMRRRYGQAPIAVSFRHHDGKVLHMTSHFYLQRSKKNRRRATSLAKKSGLGKKEIARLRAAGADPESISAGELNSAYSMQQLSSNILLDKQKDNRELLKKYNKKLTRAVELRQDEVSASKGQKAAGKKPSKPKSIGNGFRVKVLGKRGKEVKVQDLFGNEGWVPADALDGK